MIRARKPNMDSEEEDTPICEWCGFPIEEPGQQCYACDDGVTCDPDPYNV